MPSSIISPFPVFNDLDGTPLENGYIYIGQSNLNPETAPVNVFWDAARTIPAAQPIRTIGGFPSRNGSPSNVYVENDTYSITVRNSRRVFVYSAFDQTDAPSSVFDISTQVITATAGQTTFTLTTFTYLPGTDTLQVYRNGLRLTSGTDYLESSTSVVTMTSPAALGDEFLFQGGAVITGNSTPGTSVSFIQAGTGAVTRNIQEKARESVSVKDFGAVGDGVTDDTSAIQTWLTYISTNEKNGFIPSGEYKFTSPLSTANTLNWGITGYGSSSVLLKYTGPATGGDLFVIGNSSGNTINCLFSGFKIDSMVSMLSGAAINFKRLCRSYIDDVVAAGQDGSGNLRNGIRFDGVDNVVFRNFEIKAQNDGLQVNGLIGALPKADLMLDGYKISSCNVGIRYGGAYGGGSVGMGSVAACVNGVVIDTTLVAEANREIFFATETVIDACTQSNIVIDQSIASQLRVNIPSKMWCASSGSHGIWIKNANGAKIDINAYVYNIGGDGVRVDDASAFVNINGFFNTITSGYAINITAPGSIVKMGADLRFENCPNAFNYTSNRGTVSFQFPINIQNGRSIYWDTFTGVLNGSGNALIAHGKGGTFYKKVISVFASAKSTGGAWSPLTPAYIDGSNISVTGSAPLANQPYNVMCLVGDENNSGW